MTPEFLENGLRSSREGGRGGGVCRAVSDVTQSVCAQPCRTEGRKKEGGVLRSKTEEVTCQPCVRDCEGDKTMDLYSC